MKSWRMYCKCALKNPSAICTLLVKVIHWSWVLKQEIKLMVINWKGKVVIETSASGMKTKKRFLLRLNWAWHLCLM